MTPVAFRPEFAAWRKAARRLLAEGVPPAAVDWRPKGEDHQLGLLGAPTAAPPAAGPARGETAAGTATAGGPGRPARKPRVPRRFVALGEAAACHRDPGRWALLYRVLWRLVRETPHLLELDVDPDVARLRRLAKAVDRDCHKMKAFVRFRRVPAASVPGAGDDAEAGAEDAGDDLYFAWHRPDHHIVERVAPFFADRFNDQRWVIATPERSVSWDGEELVFGPGVERPPEADDHHEELWRTYYRSIFNPARLKVRTMRREMPVRHWATLPEAELIPELVRAAGPRQAAMIEAPVRPPATATIAAAAAAAAGLEEGSGDPAAPPPLAVLARALPECRACDLCTNGTRPVFGEGPADARLVLVGEQPGDVEERRGRPFVGPAGEVLDRALEEAGLARGELYLTNAVKHFKYDIGAPRGKARIHRTPGATEVSACFPWLAAELERVRPEMVVTLGATAGRSLLGAGFRLGEERGRVQPTPAGLPVLPTHHPAAVLRVPDPARRDAVYRELVEDLAAAAGG